MHLIPDACLRDAAVNVIEPTKVLLAEQAFCRAKELLPAPHEQALVRDLERILGRVRVHDNGHVLLS